MSNAACNATYRNQVRCTMLRREPIVNGLSFERFVSYHDAAEYQGRNGGVIAKVCDDGDGEYLAKENSILMPVCFVVINIDNSGY